jgi:WD40 repeat protein
VSAPDDPADQTRPLARPHRPADAPLGGTASAQRTPPSPTLTPAASKGAADSRGPISVSVAPGAEGTPTAEVATRLRTLAADASAPRYRMGDMLGRGGMGDVHAAVDRRLRREVALKTLRADRASDESAVRFFREAQVTGQLDHPNVVPVYDLGVDADGHPFYTMKRVGGRSLAELGRTDASDVRRLQIFVQVCDAIAYAHSRGVIHRDLKPANVMVGDFGEVIVLDWGLAKRVGELDEASGGAGATAEGDDEDSELTQADTLLGTPTWMAPEQATGSPATPLSDQYALGAVLYFLLTRETAFQKGAEALPKVVSGRFRSPRAVRQELSVELEAVILRAMSLDPADRYASVGALRDDVQAWLEGREVSAMRYTRAMRVRKAIRRNRRTLAVAGSVLAACAALALVVVGWGTWLYVSDIEAEEAATAAAEREARLQLADRELTLALMHTDLGLDASARGYLQRALDTLADASLPLDASVTALTSGLPPQAWFARGWIEHRRPAPLVAWDASAAPVTGVFPSADERTLALLTEGGHAYLVDTLDGRARARAHVPGEVRWEDASWDPDGAARLTWLARIRDAQGAANWQLRTASWSSAGLGNTVDLGAPNADPPRLVSTRAGRVFVDAASGGQAYDARTGQPVGPPLLRGYLQLVSADGRRYAGRLRTSGPLTRAGVDFGVWDTATDVPVLERRMRAELSLSEDGERLLVIGEQTMEYVDLGTGRTIWTLADTADEAQLGGGRVYTRRGARLAEHDPRTGATLGAWEVTAERHSDADRLLPAHRWYAVGGTSPMVYGVGETAEQDLDPTHAEAYAFSVSPDGVLVAVVAGFDDGTVRLLDARTGRLVGAFVSNPGTALTGTRDVAFSPDGSMVAAADRDGHVRVWGLDGRQVADHDHGHGIAISVDWGVGGLVAAFEGGQAVLYSVNGATPIETFHAGIRSAGGAALSPDGRQLVVSGRGVGDPAYELWDVRSHTLIRTGPVRDEPAFAVRWSPQGGHFLVTTAAGPAWLVDALHPTIPSRLEARGLSVAAVWLSEDVVAIGTQSTVRLWRIGEREPFGNMVTRDADAGVLDLARSGRTLYVLRDTPRISRVAFDVTFAPSRPLGMTSSSAAEDVSAARRLLHWRQWCEAAELLARAGNATPPALAGTRDSDLVIEQASALLAAGDVEAARRLGPRLEAAGVSPITLAVWLREAR